MTIDDLKLALSNTYEYTDVYEADSLPDGVYDLTNVAYCMIEKYEFKKEISMGELELFLKAYPDFILAHPYETEMLVVLSKRPNKITTIEGTGFNYGSCNIITDCPKIILICAEND
jgi:hypothetical protein